MLFRSLTAFAALVAYAAAVPAHSLAWHALHDVTRTVLKEGKGPTPSHFHLVTVSYKGTLKSGKAFDSSKSFSFVLGKGDVIDCWDKGVAQMHVGETAKLSCPSETAGICDGSKPSRIHNEPLTSTGCVLHRSRGTSNSSPHTMPVVTSALPPSPQATGCSCAATSSVSILARACTWAIHPPTARPREPQV